VSTYLKYADIRLGKDRLEMIADANVILDEYGAQGLDMTLRQLYYQFVARGLFANNDVNYDKLQRLVNDGRMVGLISWDAIQDRTREVRGVGAFHNSPAQALAAVADGYSRDLWVDQPWRPIAVTEKDAQLGNISRVCNELRIQYFSSRGYNSQSEQWRLGRLCAQYVRDGQRPLILDMRDHDPSGIDMTRDFRERLALFAGTPITVSRIALNMDQVIALDPPPNPAKLTDGRLEDYKAYMRAAGHGDLADTSWEFDALSPTFTCDLLTKNVRLVRDEALWEQAITKEENEREYLRDMVRMAGGAPEEAGEDNYDDD
jgi:hypothetical protein